MTMSKNVASCLVAVAMILSVAKAATYTVGDDDGWTTSADYVAWAAKNTFRVGDKLVFTYLLNHDVVEVKKEDYDSCSNLSPIATYTGGSTTLTLTTAGKRYFICGTPGHCSQGQQLAVDTLASSSAPPPPAEAESPPPSTPDTPPPPPSTPDTPPPPPSTPDTPPPPPSSTDTPPPPPSSTPGTPPPPPSSKTGTPPPPSSPKTPPPPSSGNKISYGSSFGFALIILAAI